MSSKVYGRTFVKAAELCGGRKKLARTLRVPLADLERWIEGETPPINVFLKAIDLVLDETAPPGDGLSDPADPEPPREASRSAP